jgi:hypothetical protein
MLHHHKTAFALIMVLAVALLVTIPAMAASATITSVSRVGCMISVTYTVADTGSYSLEVYENDTLLASYPANAMAGSLVVAEHLITATSSNNAVTLIVKGSGGEILDGINHFEYPSDVANNCADSGGFDSGEGLPLVQAASLPCPIPSGSVVGDMPFATSAYWAPGKLTAPVVTINPGTYWVVGVDSTAAFYQIYLSCQLMWVPVNSLQPTFQSPWNGQTLPTRTVE